MMLVAYMVSKVEYSKKGKKMSETPSESPIKRYPKSNYSQGNFYFKIVCFCTKQFILASLFHCIKASVLWNKVLYTL